MGNQIKSSKLLLSPDIYLEKLQAVSEQKDNINHQPIASFAGAGDVHVLQIIMEYSERREQVRIIEAVSAEQRNTILDNIRISPYADVYAIADFNKKNGVFDGIQAARNLMFKLFFTNLVVKGKKKNIEYLLNRDNNNFTLNFLHYIAVRKGDILSSKTENETIEIDLLVEKFKERQHKEFSFNFDDIFSSDEDKLEGVKYKHAYKFDKYDREIESNEIDVNWRVLNDTFLRYLITNQLNFCFDEEQDKNTKAVNDDLNLKDLDILSGSSLIQCPLSGYIINSTSTKHQVWKVSRSMENGRIQKKRLMTTQKLSSAFLVPETFTCKYDKDKKDDDILELGIMVLTASNSSSEDHIEEKAKFGRDTLYGAFAKIDNALGGKGRRVNY